MSNAWETLIKVEQYFESKFYATGSIIEEPGMDRFNQPGWVNKVWQSSRYRRAHIDVVDARETKSLWMMHCCIFPYTHNPAPIFGFDVIAGKNKITGCFYDYSPAGDKDHPMLEWFANETSSLQWKKTRALPDWAERIFSQNMIAASNVQTEEEIAQIYEMAKRGVDHYLDAVWETNNTVVDTTEEQNYYAFNQKQNPHTPRVMASLGLDEEDVRVFIQECLFPDIK
jgi:phycocyanobilin:ferredoxin oxidoreductase